MMRVENTIAFAEVHKKVGEWFAEITPVDTYPHSKIIRGDDPVIEEIEKANNGFNRWWVEDEEALFDWTRPAPIPLEQYRQIGKAFINELNENIINREAPEEIVMMLEAYFDTVFGTPTIKMMYRDKRLKEIDYLKEYNNFDKLTSFLKSSEVTDWILDEYTPSGISQYITYLTGKGSKQQTPPEFEFLKVLTAEETEASHKDTIKLEHDIKSNEGTELVEWFVRRVNGDEVQQEVPGNEPQQSPETPLISNEAEQIADSPAPAQTSASGKKTGKAGRPKAGHGNFLRYILKETEEEKEAFLAKLHTLIDGRTGKDVAWIIRVCVDNHILSNKPPHEDVRKEFGDIVGYDNYNKYYNGKETDWGSNCYAVSDDFRANICAFWEIS